MIAKGFENFNLCCAISTIKAIEKKLKVKVPKKVPETRSIKAPVKKAMARGKMPFLKKLTKKTKAKAGHRPR